MSIKVVRRLVKCNTYKIDVPDNWLAKAKQEYIEKRKEKGYCFLSSKLSDWVGNLQMKDAPRFRWLSIFTIYVGKHKVRDAAYCNKIRERVKGNVFIGDVGCDSEGGDNEV